MISKERRKQLKIEYLQRDEEGWKRRMCIPNTLTLAELTNVEDENLEEVIIQVIHNRIDWKHVSESLLSLPKELGLLYATWLLEGEVMNGGFDQFFGNQYILGQNDFLGEMAVKGYQLMGLPDCAQITSDSIAKFENGEVDVFDKEDRFMDTHRFEIWQVKQKYIRENMEKFVMEEPPIKKSYDEYGKGKRSHQDQLK